MKFTVNKSILLEALTSTGKCIGTSIIPILNNYRFNIENDELEITGGNQETFLTTTIAISGSGFTKSIAVPAARLLGLIKELPEQGLEFVLTENPDALKGVISYILNINANKAKYKIPVEDGTNYEVLKLKDAENFMLPYKHLFDAIDKTLYACHPEITNTLGGLNVVINGKEFTCNGCDAHVLSTITLDIEEEISVPQNLIIPPKVLSVLRTLNCDEKIAVKVSTNHIQFQVNAVTFLQSILINAKYPDVKSVIPIQNEKHLFIERLALIGVLKRSTQFISPITNSVRIDLEPEKCTISSNNDYTESATEELPIDYEGESMAIALNPKLLLSCLTKIHKEQVHLSFGTPNRPLIIRDNNDDLTAKQNLMMLMPVILQS